MKVRRGKWSIPLLALLPLAAGAQAPAATQPEIQRPPGTPQAVGAVHTVRQIPEACVRIEGRFTGQADAPYAMQPVRTDPRCQPRAALLDFARVRPGEDGWRLNDRIRIPAAACPGQQAVVEVWRRPVEQPLVRDGQGQVRVYLGEARQQADAGKLASLPAFAVRMTLQGTPCR
ncbi:hypothetical protein B1L07_12635 [Stenotrophomonas acidaminiphila]|nr:hypothetical protein B1L07_12635 [Stenotrophomonas acidaminiphila]